MGRWGHARKLARELHLPLAERYPRLSGRNDEDAIPCLAGRKWHISGVVNAAEGLTDTTY